MNPRIYEVFYFASILSLELGEKWDHAEAKCLILLGSLRKSLDIKYEALGWTRLDVFHRVETICELLSVRVALPVNFIKGDAL